MQVGQVFSGTANFLMLLMSSLVIDCLHQFNSLHLLNFFYFFLAQLMDTHLKSSKSLFHLLLTSYLL